MPANILPLPRGLLRAWMVALAMAALIATDASAATARRDVIGTLRVHVAEAEETLHGIAIRNNLGYVEIVAANPGVDPWQPREGTGILLPTMHILPDAERRGIVINLADMRLYWFRPGRRPVSMPLGIGSEGKDSPLGSTKVLRKRANPTWYPPPSIRAEDPTLPRRVWPGPDNPLGAHALYLGWPAILIHGTNQPYSIGRRVSHGCFRLHPDKVAMLYREVPAGTPVRVVDQAVKIGWLEGHLYLEIHPTLAQATEIEETGNFLPEPAPDLRERVLHAAGPSAERVDWMAVTRAAEARSGVPVRITR